MVLKTKRNVRRDSGKHACDLKNVQSKTLFFQPKLTVGPTDDVYEREADAVADRVMSINDHEQIQTKISPIDIQRKCAACEEEESLQRKQYDKEEAKLEAPSIVSEALNSGGKPLDKATKTFMEGRFGYDFSNVRIHSDTVAAKSAESINALAYTSGNDILFNEGGYNPHSDSGGHLLAHELTHVVQQGGARSTIQRDVGWARSGSGTPYGPPLTGSNSSTVTETISNAPAPYTAWNGTYSWSSRFDVLYDLNTFQITVVMRLFSSATPAVKAAWESAIESKWSNKYSFNEYDAAGKKTTSKKIVVDVQWVSDAANAHYSITPSAPGTTSGGRAGIGGTTSMTDWGTSDTVDIAHEFGHMLGNAEEYFTTNGVDYTVGGTRSGFRDPGGNIMNNPSGNPTASHYELVRTTVRDVLGLDNARCKIE